MSKPKADKFIVKVVAAPASASIKPLPLRVLLSKDDALKLDYVNGDFVHLQNDAFDITKSKSIGIVQISPKIQPQNIQISGIAAMNANLDGANFVYIQRSEILPMFAKTIHVTSNDLNVKQDDYLNFYLAEILCDLEWVVDGQYFECLFSGVLTIFQLNVKKFNVEVLNESIQIYRVNRETKILLQLLDTKEEVLNLTYGAIGGLEKEMADIKEMVEMSLKLTDRFTVYGIKPPKGLLLYGPPGTGKTMIAKSIAAEAGVTVLVINGPELLSKYYGETETKAVFDEAAEKSPSIIFIDEIDAICPKRDSSDTELEKRVVATLLTLMDGADLSEIDDRARIFVIAATNRPNAIDDALRRPGRFDFEIEIGIPTPVRRLDILNRLLSTIPHKLSSEEKDHISGIAHGYVGADLAAVCREAGMNAIKRVEDLLGVEVNDDTISNDPRLLVINEDMIIGMSKVRPSVVREIEVQVPKVYWDQIGGQEETKERLKEAVEWPLKHPELFQRFNIRPPKGVLLYGPPGCSKTLMAKALATEASLNFIAVKGPELFSKWVGESEKAVQQLFKKARAASPSIIFFDEIDAIASRRAGGDSSVSDRVLSQLLTEMDGIDPLVNVTIVAATNRPDILDSALLRPGRIDCMLYIGPPDASARLQIFEIQTKTMPIHDDVDLSILSDLSDGFSGAEIVAACQEAAMSALEENLDALYVTQSQFVAATSKITKRITPEMIAFYKSFESESGRRAV